MRRAPQELWYYLIQLLGRLQPSLHRQFAASAAFAAFAAFAAAFAAAAAALRRRPPPRVGEVRGGAATSFVGAACATGRALPPRAITNLWSAQVHPLRQQC